MKRNKSLHTSKFWGFTSLWHAYLYRRLNPQQNKHTKTCITNHTERNPNISIKQLLSITLSDKERKRWRMHERETTKKSHNESFQIEQTRFYKELHISG